MFDATISGRFGNEIKWGLTDKEIAVLTLSSCFFDDARILWMHIFVALIENIL